METKQTRSTKEIGFNNDKLLDHINRRIDYMVSQALERLTDVCVRTSELSDILANGHFTVKSLKADTILADVIEATDISADKLSGQFDKLIASEVKCDELDAVRVTSELLDIATIESPFTCQSISADKILVGGLSATNALIGDLECPRANIDNVRSEYVKTIDLASGTLDVNSIACKELISQKCTVLGELDADHIETNNIVSIAIGADHGYIGRFNSDNVESDVVVSSRIMTEGINADRLSGSDVDDIVSVTSNLCSLKDGIVVSNHGKLVVIQPSDISHDSLTGLDTASHNKYVQLNPANKSGQIIEGSLSVRGLDAIELASQSAVFGKATIMEAGSQPLPLPIIRKVSDFTGRNPQIAVLGGKVVLSSNGRQSVIGETAMAGKHIATAVVSDSGTVELTTLPVDVLSCIIEIRMESGHRPAITIGHMTSNSIRFSINDVLLAGQTVKVLFCEVK